MPDSGAIWPPVYNPALLDEQGLARSSCVRSSLLERVLDSLRLPHSVPHWLFHGGPGSGKSALLRFIAAAVGQDTELRRRWAPLLLQGPVQGFIEPFEIWEAVLGLLAEDLTSGGNAQAAGAIHAVVAALPEGDSAMRNDAALWSLGAWAERNRGLLVFVDGLDDLAPAVAPSLARLSAHASLRLVATTRREPSADLLAWLGGPDLVRQQRLGPLSLADARAVVADLAQATGSQAVLDFLALQPARFQALHALVGGRPRGVLLLAQVLALSPSIQGHQALERVLDLLSPGFQAQLDALPAQAAQIVLALGRAWDPCSAAEVARSCRMHVNKASAQLVRLQGAGLVQKTPLHSTRRHGFLLADRELALWCLMVGGRRTRQELRNLVSFLERQLAPAPRSPRLPLSGGGLSLFRSKAWRKGAIDRAGLLADPPVQGRPAGFARGSVLDDASLEDAHAAPVDPLLRLQAAAPGVEPGGAPPCWPTSAAALRELVQEGRVSEALALLTRPGLAERWRPVVEALLAVQGGDAARLLDVAPELRAPAVEILASIWPEGERPGA